MPYSFVWLYLSKCDVCVLNHIWINSKRFLIILYVFGSDFYHFVFMFSAYFVFHYLNMFCVLKQVSNFLATHSGYLREQPASCKFWLLILAICKSWVQAVSLHRMSWWLTLDSSVVKRPKSAFYRAFSWKTCFKPLLSSLKPLFQYFYIKT